MPNHIINKISVDSDSKSLSEFRKIAEFLRADGEPLGSVDFNRLIPMPPELNIECGSRGIRGMELYTDFLRRSSMLAAYCVVNAIPADVKAQLVAKLCLRFEDLTQDDPEVWELGKKYYDNLKNHGATTWYEWCNSNWDTKWNAYGCVPIEESADTLEFQTAWAGVPKIVRKLSELFPSVMLTYQYADENIGYNVGRIIFQCGEVIDSYLPAEGSREAYETAASIRGVDLKEYGFVLKKDGSTYRFKEDASAPERDAAEPARKPKKKKSRDQSR